MYSHNNDTVNLQLATTYNVKLSASCVHATHLLHGLPGTRKNLHPAQSLPFLEDTSGGGCNRPQVRPEKDAILSENIPLAHSARSSPGQEQARK
jgi:hypothetical protein